MRFVRGVAVVTVLSAMLAAGCGEPLVSGPTFESPLVSFSPYFDEMNDEGALAGKRIGIVWIDPLQLRDDVPHPPRGYTVTRADHSYTVRVFTPPPEAAIRRIPDPMTNEVAVSFAFGEIVLYDDGDGDGQFSVTPRDEGSQIRSPDTYRASTEDRVFLYVEQPAVFGGPVGVAWFTLFEPPGFRIARIDCSLSEFNPPVRTEGPSFPMLYATNPSATLIATRRCLSSVPRTLM